MGDDMDALRPRTAPEVMLASRALRALRGFTRLAADDRRLLVTAYVTIWLTDIALRLFGFRRLMGFMLPGGGAGAAAPGPSGRPTVTASQQRRASRFAYWLEVASQHHPIQARCLHRSLALHFWLRRKRLPSQLRIGVRKVEGELRAHAWIEMEGRVVNDRAADVVVFSVLPGLDAPAVLWRRSSR